MVKISSIFVAFVNFTRRFLTKYQSLCIPELDCELRIVWICVAEPPLEPTTIWSLTETWWLWWFWWFVEDGLRIVMGFEPGPPDVIWFMGWTPCALESMKTLPGSFDIGPTMLGMSLSCIWFVDIWKYFLNIYWHFILDYLKFIYSEKVTEFCKISTVDLTVTTYRLLRKICDWAKMFK